MTLNSQELERLEDQLWAGERIYHSLYCGECGYNLRTLPYTGLCPECGGRYNARPLKMEGIFLPQNMELPVLDVLMLGIAVTFSILFIRDSINPYDSARMFIGVVGLILSLVFGHRAWSKFSRFLKFRSILKQIESAEDD
jgi:hypothetical protein